MDLSKSSYEKSSYNPSFVFERNEETIDIAVFGRGVSIENDFYDYMVEKVEEYGFLIPAKYRLALQINKILGSMIGN